MKVLFIITARGGSKGVPRKNIVPLNGYPLIAYKIIAAKKCRYDSRIIVSTDDEEIAGVAKQYGAEVPFMRPAELATDQADSMDVLAHAIDWVSKNDTSRYDYLCLLEPSSPFASYIDLDNAIEMIIQKKADTLLSVKEAEVSSAFIHSLDEDGKLSIFYDSIIQMKSVRRQDQKAEYTMNGCIYLAGYDYFVRNRLFHSKNSVPYIMPPEASVEIDSMLDYEVARMILEKGLVDMRLWQEE